MSNPYYTHNDQFRDGKLGRGPPVDAEFEKVEQAFDAVYALFPLPGAGFPVNPAVNPTDAVQLQQFQTWQFDINANSHFLHNVHDPVAVGDAANKGWTQSEISAQILAGGSPGSVQITALNKGTATAKQVYRCNTAGTGVEAVTPTVAVLLNIGAAAAGDQIQVNAGGTAFETFTPAMMDTDLADATAAIFAYEFL